MEKLLPFNTSNIRLLIIILLKTAVSYISINTIVFDKVIHNFKSVQTFRNISNGWSASYNGEAKDNKKSGVHFFKSVEHLQIIPSSLL